MAAQTHYYSKNPLNCELMINDRSFFISYENIFFEIDNSLLIICHHQLFQMLIKRKLTQTNYNRRKYSG